jgi:hypothetical protein
MERNDITLNQAVAGDASIDVEGIMLDGGSATIRNATLKSN